MPLGMRLNGTIVVVNRQAWSGDQRLGAFQVAVDRQEVGVAFPLDRLRIPCAPGVHTVRLRQWWFRSPPVEVTLQGGDEVRLAADGPIGRSFLRRMAVLTFRPSQALRLIAEAGSKR